LIFYHIVSVITYVWATAANKQQQLPKRQQFDKYSNLMGLYKLLTPDDVLRERLRQETEWKERTKGEVRTGRETEREKDL